MTEGMCLDKATIRVSGRYLDRMISEEVSEGIASTRVAIAGFSQVGITASIPYECFGTIFIPLL